MADTDRDLKQRLRDVLTRLGLLDSTPTEHCGDHAADIRANTAQLTSMTSTLTGQEPPTPPVEGDDMSGTDPVTGAISEQATAIDDLKGAIESEVAELQSSIDKLKGTLEGDEAADLAVLEQHAAAIREATGKLAGATEQLRANDPRVDNTLPGDLPPEQQQQRRRA